MPPVTCSLQTTTSFVTTSLPATKPSAAAEPAPPTDLNCYSNKTTALSSPFRSFNEHDAESKIAEFCASYSENAFPSPKTGHSPWTTNHRSNPTTGSSCQSSVRPGVGIQICRSTWRMSAYLLYVLSSGIVSLCSHHLKLLSNIRIGDPESNTKWGGTGNWECMDYKINGLDDGRVTTGWDGNSWWLGSRSEENV
jgi:hypothetical protein